MILSRLPAGGVCDQRHGGILVPSRCAPLEALNGVRKRNIAFAALTLSLNAVPGAWVTAPPRSRMDGASSRPRGSYAVPGPSASC